MEVKYLNLTMGPLEFSMENSEDLVLRILQIPQGTVWAHNLMSFPKRMTFSSFFEEVKSYCIMMLGTPGLYSYSRKWLEQNFYEDIPVSTS